MFVCVGMLKCQLEESIDVAHDINAISAGFVIWGRVVGWKIFQQGFVNSQMSAGRGSGSSLGPFLETLHEELEIKGMFL